MSRLCRGRNRYDHIIDGYEVMFAAVAREFYRENFGRAIDYYEGMAFPMLQMVWPDRNAVFPWEPAAIRPSAGCSRF